MSCLQINSCCCCFGLEQGSRIIGFLHTICATFLVGYTSFLASDAKQQIGTIDDIDGTYTAVHRYTTIIACVGSVHIVLGLVLIIGAFKRVPRLLLAWTVLMTFLYVAAILFSMAITVMYGPRQSGWDMFIASLQGAAFFVIVGYLILCVRSYYCMLKSDRDMCGPED